MYAIFENELAYDNCEWADALDWYEVMKDHFNGSKKYRLIQGIGIKDKNGKEIYEGYIVRFADADQSPNGDYDTFYSEGVVEYDESIGAYIVSNRVSVDMEDLWDDVEIIGNKFENPELLSKY